MEENPVGKVAGMWILYWSIISVACGRSSHGSGGLVPHQPEYRWAGVVWAARCRNGVMICCWLWLFCTYLSFLVNGAIGLHQEVTRVYKNHLNYTITGSSQEVETTGFDPASVFLSTHRWSQQPSLPVLFLWTIKKLPPQPASFHKPPRNQRKS